ncbi:hypothetical protein HOY82DRAFT_566834, partial [Tuber indicum]
MWIPTWFKCGVAGVSWWLPAVVPAARGFLFPVVLRFSKRCRPEKPPPSLTACPVAQVPYRYEYEYSTWGLYL